MIDMINDIGKELKAHAPFTMVGAATAIVIMVVMAHTRAPHAVSHGLFWAFHPLHVLLSALVTAGMYRLHGKWFKLTVEEFDAMMEEL